MKIIDEKGRLLGLINIIDLMALLLLIVIALIGINKITGREARHEPGAATVHLEFLISEIRQQTVDAIQTGDVVIDSTSRQVFGTIKEKRVLPFRKPAPTANGSFVLADVPERFDVYLDLECSGHDFEDVLRIASHEIRIGTSLVVQTKDYSIEGKVLKVEIRAQEPPE
ncbi:MAG: DUF4330 domain-containing protein [Firmicutes bacterium]|nr:DUF4330 domain-containing protein [Bacillota bacterium]